MNPVTLVPAAAGGLPSLWELTKKRSAHPDLWMWRDHAVPAPLVALGL
jgi:hypothetical protein